MLSSEFTPPSQFDEFRLIRPLGRGAMGQVFLCQDTKLERPVAVKFIRSAYADPESQQRFGNEAKAIARLNHQNVVAVYRMGECCGQPYIASQYIAGKSLESLPKPAPWQKVLRIGLGLARGLAAAHRQNVLHRDIKPANIMLADDGEVKLLDFGLAKLTDSVPRLHIGSTDTALPSDAGLQETLPGNPGTESSQSSERPGSLTQTGDIMGTPLFMSPEAWRGEVATMQSDMYSLGVVLYELLSGAPPHLKSTLVSLREEVLLHDARPLHSVAPQADPRLCEIVDRCLKRRSEERYPTTDDLCLALEELTLDAAASSRSFRWPLHQRSWPAVAAVGLLLTLFTVGGWRLYPALRDRGDMATFKGASFRMGSTPREMEAAFDWCKLESRDNCVEEHYLREQPMRQVTLAPFRLDRREVTNAQFVEWLNRQQSLELRSEKYIFQNGVVLANIYPTIQPTQGIVLDPVTGRYKVLPGYERKPVMQVTWNGASQYCRGHGKRLPSEAEWEYAARGTSDRRFPWGDDKPRCEDVAVAQGPGQACARNVPSSSDVGISTQDRTPDGVYDLGGNVSEWVEDIFVPRYPSCPAPCQNPVANAVPESGMIQRVIRGGSWSLAAAAARSAGRSRWRQDEGLLNTGFRCAASGPQ
jgi:serine/threonine protein kinase